MTDENEIDNEANNIDINGKIENYHQPPLKMILETSNNSKIECSVHNVIRKHFLEQRSITWKPIKVELIVNTQLTDDFFAIRKKFEKASDGNRSEFEEHYGFLIENDNQISEICNNGYHCTETPFNVLGHSKCGVYVCKYADVCIRQASVRRTWEGSVTIKMLIFKIVEGKQTAALVRKGPKLQPIAPTPLFTSHSSVITPKETDDLEKQFDQSQIFLYEFEGREAVKRPHHCLPYAIVSLIQDGSQWPTNFDDLDIVPDILETDTLRVIAQADDPLLQNKMKENVELAEAATLALEHIYEEEPPPPSLLPIPVEPPQQELEQQEQQQQQQQSPIQTTDTETIPTIVTSDNTSSVIINGIEPLVLPVMLNDNLSETSPPSTVVLINNTDALLDSTIQPPPPPPPSSSPSSSSSSTVQTISTAKTPITVVTTTPATTLPLSHQASAIQAAYRQQASLLGALPTAAALRTVPGAVYATTAGLSNGLNGQIVYGGVSLDALRGYQTASGAAGSPYVLATQGGQTIQQPALYAAQLQAVAQQQQQQAQMAAAIQQQQQQQQQQSLMSGIPAGCMLVRTANGGKENELHRTQPSLTHIYVIRGLFGNRIQNFTSNALTYIQPFLKCLDTNTSYEQVVERRGAELIIRIASNLQYMKDALTIIEQMKDIDFLNCNQEFVSQAEKIIQLNYNSSINTSIDCITSSTNTELTSMITLETSTEAVKTLPELQLQTRILKVNYNIFHKTTLFGNIDVLKNIDKDTVDHLLSRFVKRNILKKGTFLKCDNRNKYESYMKYLPSDQLEEQQLINELNKHKISLKEYHEIYQTSNVCPPATIITAYDKVELQKQKIEFIRTNEIDQERVVPLTSSSLTNFGHIHNVNNSVHTFNQSSYNIFIDRQLDDNVCSTRNHTTPHSLFVEYQTSTETTQNPPSIGNPEFE
ncbi:unnamed protein product [Adineta steineri]|uniref:TASOR pseudo-PARP domain-containing protein n=1 Tax=Adineta steineri TaxID=433720 RepID=A0A815D2L7_9BILA|nr:unnamed protein product [Adineta steineri]